MSFIQNTAEKFVGHKTKLKWKFVWVEKLEGEVLVQKLAGAHIFKNSQSNAPDMI